LEENPLDHFLHDLSLTIINLIFFQNFSSSQIKMKPRSHFKD
jgi:hypothetical protein